MRIIFPVVVSAIRSLSSSTITTPIRSPVFGVSFIQITPFPPRFVKRYSFASVRLPIPFWLTLKISSISFLIKAAPTTSSPFSLNLMPVTPRVTLPIWRIFSSLNLTHIPFLVTIKSIFSLICSSSTLSSVVSTISFSTTLFSPFSAFSPFSSLGINTSFSPFVTIKAVTNSSSSSSLIAFTPIERIFLNSLKFVRFTIPFLVKNAKDLLSQKSLVGIIALIFSPS